MAESPAFQQFALRSAAWAKRLVETPLPKVRGGGRSAKAAAAAAAAAAETAAAAAAAAAAASATV